MKDYKQIDEKIHVAIKNYNDIANVLKQFNELLKNGIDISVVSDAMEAFCKDAFYKEEFKSDIQSIPMQTIADFMCGGEVMSGKIKNTKYD